MYKKFLEENEVTHGIDSYCRFFGVLAQSDYAPSVIREKMYQLKFRLNLNGMTDFSTSLSAQLFLRGLQNFSHKYVPKGCKKSIPYDLLTKMINAASFCATSKTEEMLLKAMFTTAFFGLFRMGELMQYRRAKSNASLLREDMTVGSDYTTLRVRDAKTAAKGELSSVQLVETGDSICHARHLKNYHRFEPGLTGPLFRTRKMTPVTHYLFVRMLEAVLKFLNVSSAAVKPHSFHHGGACYLRDIGASLEFIMSKGRWKSHAVHTYVGKTSSDDKQGVLKRKGKINKFRFNQLFDDADENEAILSLPGAPPVGSNKSVQE